MNSTIWAIPGFLGLSSDWDFLDWKNLIGVNLHPFAWDSLFEWGIQFNAWVEKQEKNPAILMGYSLGGRLALHALLDRPQQWQAAIIISAHIGIENVQEKEKRWQRDQKWTQRFEREDWVSLMQAWNAQEVFKQDDFHFNRQEKQYQRAQLMQCLMQGSLGQQANLREQIASLSVPLLWITGGQDHSYCQLAQTLSFAHPQSRWKKIEQAGHRVPWAQSKAFSQCVQAFLEEV